MLSEVKSTSGGEEEVSDQNEVQLHQPEPFNLRHHLAKEEIKPEKPKRKFSLSLPAILVSIFIFIVTTLAIGIIFYNKQTQTKIASINDFESCAAAGNPIMESYPEKCTANGQTFTRELTEEEQKKLDPTADWQTFTNDGRKYSFKYPSDWQYATRASGESGELIKTADLKMTNYSDVEKGAFIYEPYTFGPGITGETWEGVLESLPIDSEVTNTALDNQEAKIVTSKNENSVTSMVLYKYPKPILFQGSTKPIEWSFITLVSSPDDFENYKQIFDQILSTFKFTDQNSATDTSSWKTFSGKSSYNPNFAFQIKYPPTCLIKEADSGSFIGNPTIINCLDGAVQIDPEAGGHGASVINQDEVVLKNKTWKRTLLGVDNVSGASYSLVEAINSIKVNFLMEIYYKNYNLDEQKLVEQIISTFEPNN